MRFELAITDEAIQQLKKIKYDKGLFKCFKAVEAALKKLAENPRHQSLQTYVFHSLFGPNGEKVFEAYAQQNTPAAYRIFFYYGPKQGVITIFNIISHP